VAEQVLPRTSAVVLAGGASQRMGRDKALVEFDGEPLLARVIERVRTLSEDIIIVANDAEAFARFGVPVIPDVYPGKGSLGGIFSGLRAAREPYALAVACDMPFLNLPLLHYLISLAPPFDVVIPRAQDPSGKVPRSTRGDKPEGSKKSRPIDSPIAKESNLHPMHAVYSKRCLQAMERRLLADDLRLISFHPDVRVRIVEPSEVEQFDPQRLSFFNANTPEDLATASRLVHLSPP
jgi:molybdopterin-guanine dinucleotide biosynthesis protein A